MNLDFLADAGAALSLIDLTVALALATALGLGLAILYRLTFTGFTFERTFLVTLVTMPPIVAVVMAFIANNLALSLGMVGALSIIRFRTVIKDARDMVFLFWTIAIGLGCGTNNWLASVVASAFLAAVLLVLHFVRFGAAKRTDYVLIVRGERAEALAAARQMVQGVVDGAQLRSLEQDDEGWELVLELRLGEAPAEAGAETIGWVDDLRALAGVGRVSLLAPQLSLPV